MLDLNSVFIGTCLFAVSSGFTMMFRRVPTRQLRSVLQMSSVAKKVDSIPSSSITLVDFLLPAKENEIIQNLVNDEIIANSIIGTV